MSDPATDDQVIDTTAWVHGNATTGWPWCDRCQAKEQHEPEGPLLAFIYRAEEFATIHAECPAKDNS